MEIALPTGIAIGTRKISNTNSGFAELLAWILDHAPGPRVVVSIEGTRSFGVGLARAVAAAGLAVIECEQPNHKARRGKGKSDPIDAHLAVLAALRLDADRLPVPSRWHREARRILPAPATTHRGPHRQTNVSARCCWAGDAHGSCSCELTDPCSLP